MIMNQLVDKVDIKLNIINRNNYVIFKCWQQAIFPVPLGKSIVAPRQFHVQVRDGLTWDQPGKVTNINIYVNIIEKGQTRWVY